MRTGLILAAHTYDPGQMWIWCAGDVIVVIVVFRCGPYDWKLSWSRWHVALWSVFTPRDCDLLNGSGHCRWRGNVLVHMVLSCHVLLVAFHGGYLLHDGWDKTGAMCTDLGLTEVERVQIALQSAVIQTLALQITLCKFLAFWHHWDWQPRPNSEGLNLPHNAFGHCPVKKNKICRSPNAGME